MTAVIQKIPGHAHMAKVRDAREQRGLPVTLGKHPFASLPFWTGQGR